MAGKEGRMMKDNYEKEHVFCCGDTNGAGVDAGDVRQRDKATPITDGYTNPVVGHGRSHANAGASGDTHGA